MGGEIGGGGNLMNAHLIGPGKSRAAVNQRKTKMKRRKVENDGIGGREAIGATKHWGVFEAKEYLCWVGLEFGMDFLNFLQGSKFKGMLQLTHHRLPRLSTFRHFFITTPPPGATARQSVRMYEQANEK